MATKDSLEASLHDVQNQLRVVEEARANHPSEELDGVYDLLKSSRDVLQQSLLDLRYIHFER